MLKTTTNFAPVDLLSKLGEVGRNIYTDCWSFTYDRTFGIHWWPSTAWLLSAVDWLKR